VDLIAAVRDAAAVTPVGARTQWEVGGPPPTGAIEVHAPVGVLAYEPGDMTITVGAGTSFAELDAALAEHGQECPLDPTDPSASVGGILACGLSGRRRLRYGPLRDHVLEVRAITGDARAIKGGGPTVKNVTGYDLPRLFVGSFGTLGVLTQVTLRCRPRPQVARWFALSGDGDSGRVTRPSAHLRTRAGDAVLIEGRAVDVAAQTDALAECEPPEVLRGAHRGRISVGPARVDEVVRDLDGAEWHAELDVGTVHVASDDIDVFTRARAVAHAHGGWLLREAGGAPDDDGYGRPLPNVDLMRRIKIAFDPDRKLNAERLPL
jgi:glycolate oxidase FAD binding subunit